MQYTQEPTPSQEPEVIPTKHALKSGAYIVSGKFFSALASFAAVTVLGNVVPKEVAGTYNYIIAVFTIISITTLPGMNNALARAVAKGYDGNVNRTLRKRFLFGTLGIIVSTIIGIVYLALGNTNLGIAFLIIAPFVPLTDTLSNFTMSFWQGKKDFKKSALYGALYYIGFGCLNIIVFITTHNLWLILLGVLTGQALAGWLVFQSIKRQNTTYDPASAQLGYHLTAMLTLKTIAGNIDRVIVWHLAGPIMVAAYSFAATPIFKLYQFLPIGTVSLPHLSNQTFNRQTKQLVLKKAFTLFMFTIPIAIIGILLAPTVYGVLFSKYPESVRLFQVMVAGIAFAPVMLIDAAFVAFHKTKQLYITELSSPIIRVTLMVGLGIHFGIMGIVIGIFLTSVIDSIVSFGLFLFGTPAEQGSFTGKKSRNQ